MRRAKIEAHLVPATAYHETNVEIYREATGEELDAAKPFDTPLVAKVRISRCRAVNVISNDAGDSSKEWQANVRRRADTAQVLSGVLLLSGVAANVEAQRSPLSYCCDCGRPFEVLPDGRKPIRCPECRYGKWTPCATADCTKMVLLRGVSKSDLCGGCSLSRSLKEASEEAKAHRRSMLNDARGSARRAPALRAAWSGERGQELRRRRAPAHAKALRANQTQRDEKKARRISVLRAAIASLLTADPLASTRAISAQLRASGHGCSPNEVCAIVKGMRHG